jgi:putative transposase
MTTFFDESDYLRYLDLLRDAMMRSGVEIWAYCLMPNHVHLVVVPAAEDSLARLFGQVHRRYTLRINEQHDWAGHLWQERFHSCVLDELHLLAAVRYVELNPVRAGLCAAPDAWRWSSALAHHAGSGDGIVTVQPMLERVRDWRGFLDSDHPIDPATLRRCARSGRPAGDGGFIRFIEQTTGRVLPREKPGRPSMKY